MSKPRFSHERFQEGVGGVSTPRTTPGQFCNPYPARNKLGRLAWSFAFWTVYRWTPPRRGMWFRRLILRLFGAEVGDSWIHPSTRIWAPWLLQIGDECFVDSGCHLYNAFGIEIRDRSIVSFGTTICTASHEYKDPSYRLVGAKVTIGRDSWVTAECFICPGIEIGDGAVCGARSVVTKSVPAWTVVAGNPAAVRGKRTLALESI